MRIVEHVLGLALNAEKSTNSTAIAETPIAVESRKASQTADNIR